MTDSEQDQTADAGYHSNDSLSNPKCRAGHRNVGCEDVLGSTETTDTTDGRGHVSRKMVMPLCKVFF